MELLANCADVETKVNDREAQIAEDDDADDNNNVKSVFSLLGKENDNEEQQQHQNNKHECSSYGNEDVTIDALASLYQFGDIGIHLSTSMDYSTILKETIPGTGR